MHKLLKKELTIIIASWQAAIILCIFLVISGFLLWILPGKYNILENGYASLDSFFFFAPVLFLILLPALTMRLFSEEKKTGTAELLFTYPLRITEIVLAKFFAVVVVITLMLLLTGAFVFSLYYLSNPIGNIDFCAILTAYFGLFLLALLFLSVGLFTSSCTSNQITALIFSVLLCSVLYWGFNLFSLLIENPQTQLIARSIEASFHLSVFIKGVISFASVFYFLFLSFFFLVLTEWKINQNHSSEKLSHFSIFTFGALFCCYLLFQFVPVRFDMTEDKKYTLSNYSKRFLRELKTNMEVIVYLDGDMDSDYLQLKQETGNMLNTLNQYTSLISYQFINPNKAESNEERQKQRTQLLNRDMKDVLLTKTDQYGNLQQQSVFPWADIINGHDTIAIPLLATNNRNQSEQISLSVSELEYKFMNAFFMLTQTEIGEIAFLEGHGETPEAYIYDAMEALSQYFHVFSGKLDNVTEIPPYNVLIIANPTEKFTEKEKFLLDQYLVSGGSIMLLVNSAIVHYDALMKGGNSPSMENDVNLNDLLFHYGIRINPVLLQDLQCAYIPLKIGETDTYQQAPWYYAPLLEPDLDHPLTKNLLPVKSEFAGSIDFVGNNEEIRKHVLLTSSKYAHLVALPVMIYVDDPNVKESPEYFNQQYVPVGALLEGSFQSAFKGRMLPEGFYQKKDKDKEGKLLVVASGSIIRNEIQWGSDNKGIALPLGYDRYMDMRFGNKDFIVNAVNYLAGNKEQLFLRNKQHKLYILDKTKIRSEKTFWQYFNLIVPVGIVLLLTCYFNWRRKRIYG